MRPGRGAQYPNGEGDSCPVPIRFLAARTAGFNADGRTNLILIRTAGSVEVVLGRQPQRIPVFTRDWFETRSDTMNDRIREVIRQKLGDALDVPFPSFTPREAGTAALEGKVRAVIGMRRAGKTTFLNSASPRFRTTTTARIRAFGAGNG